MLLLLLRMLMMLMMLTLDHIGVGVRAFVYRRLLAWMGLVLTRYPI